MPKNTFTPEQLSVLNEVMEPVLNFETPVISAVFKPKLDNYTDEKWDRAIDILHSVLPLDGCEVNGEYIYRPFYQDEDSLNKSAGVYVALKNYQDELKQPNIYSDAYYYGSESNKEAHLEYFNKFFNVVRFSQDATGPFWYALEVAIPETEDRGYKLLSGYISPRRMLIDKPQWVENGGEAVNSVGPCIFYDFGSNAEYNFFKKIATDLEFYQKRKAEYENPLLKWEPKRILAYGMKIDKQHTR
ncbi:MAG: hypothetical protein J6V11_04550 [Alphaproteobacteria bacterium]|nr:hypothetical protein [Alphaproteobacteria bacterium]